MKTAGLLACSAALAVVAGAGAAALLRPASSAADPARSDELARLSAALESMESQQRELRSTLDQLALQSGGGGARGAVSVADLDAAVARYLNGQAVAAAGASGPAEVAPV